MKEFDKKISQGNLTFLKNILVSSNYFLKESNFSKKNMVFLLIYFYLDLFSKEKMMLTLQEIIEAYILFKSQSNLSQFTLSFSVISFLFSTKT